DGSDQSKYSQPLEAAGYLPKSRAPFCPQEWAGLNYGWWTQLEPHFSDGFKDQGTKEQKKARAKVIAEREALEKNIDQLRAEAGKHPPSARAGRRPRSMPSSERTRAPPPTA